MTALVRLDYVFSEDLCNERVLNLRLFGRVTRSLTINSGLGAQETEKLVVSIQQMGLRMHEFLVVPRFRVSSYEAVLFLEYDLHDLRF